MRLLSIAIPCFNSQDYMRRCVDTLLTGGEEVEILIVNDGSVDATAAIAEEYAAAWPGRVKALHKENGGHGDAVMCGLRAAQGLYFKVVDSDDWVDTDALSRVLNVLRANSTPDKLIDLVVANYVYEKENAARKHIVRYGNALPEGRTLRWENIKHFRIGQYILMHAAIYRRKLLLDCGLSLPKHTFYVDNLYVYKPLMMVETLYYINADLYRYFIGRSDQSVNEQVMISRIDQQIRVNRIMMEVSDFSIIMPKKKCRYMRGFLTIITAVSSILLVKDGSPEALAKKDLLWADMKREHPEIYRSLRRSLLGLTLHLPGRTGRRAMLWIYAAANRVFGFN
ncbi:MAG: glycosyltransferase family 2 protein [Clostridia bacterium]|nr:glycosyltransferase family 2 protein [Clostridia bacterium]